MAARARPRRRSDELIVTELADETVVYDLRRHKARCLNRTAALVWSFCDGKTSVSEMTRRLEERFGTALGDAWTRRALQQLDDAYLLDTPLDAPSGKRLSRRELLRKSSAAAAAALPVVVSLVVPTAAIAGNTCFPPNCIRSSACRAGVDVCKCCGPPNCVKKCDASGNCSNAVSGC
jgi:hypothetical protein